MIMADEEIGYFISLTHGKDKKGKRRIYLTNEAPLITVKLDKDYATLIYGRHVQRLGQAACE